MSRAATRASRSKGLATGPTDDSAKSLGTSFSASCRNKTCGLGERRIRPGGERVGIADSRWAQIREVRRPEQFPRRRPQCGSLVPFTSRLGNGRRAACSQPAFQCSVIRTTASSNTTKCWSAWFSPAKRISRARATVVITVARGPDRTTADARMPPSRAVIAGGRATGEMPASRDGWRSGLGPTGAILRSRRRASSRGTRHRGCHWTTIAGRCRFAGPPSGGKRGSTAGRRC